MDTHPDVKVDKFISTTAKTYRAPMTRCKPNWRERVKGVDINPDRSKSSSCYNLKASGYVVNSTLFDGTGWVPEKNLNSDMVRTEYRNKFNPSKPFHLS